MKIIHKSLLLAFLLAAGLACSRQPEYHIYMGNTHAHCNFSGDIIRVAERENRPLDPRNDVDNNIIAGRDAGLQFYCLTDHAYLKRFKGDVWETLGEWAEKLTENGKFVALRGFEYSRDTDTDGRGHANVYNTSQFVSADPNAYDLHAFQDWLALPENEGALVCYNHPQKGGFNKFALYNEAEKSKFAMIEVINGNNTGVNSIYYERFLDVLEAGYRVAPVAGCDNHSVEALPKWKARTGIAASELTPEGVINAFTQRRAYATMDKDLKIFYTVNGQPMGSILKPKKGNLKFDIEASTGDAVISKIDIMGEGGKMILSKEFDRSAVKWKVTVPQGQKYYFLIVYEKDVDSPVAWVAPVWTDNS